MINFDELKQAIGDLDDEVVNRLLDELVKADGEGAAQALAACQQGMDIIGDRYETGEYFVADLVFAGDLMTEAANKLKPFLAGETTATIGNMVFCTVKGDIHDIGKNIVKALLEADGVNVIDLGVDVSSNDIIAAIKENNAAVLGLSGVLTLALDSMKDTIEALTDAGLREGIKVIIGGAPVTAEYCKLVGADAWSINAAESVGICHKWLAG